MSYSDALQDGFEKKEVLVYPQPLHLGETRVGEPELMVRTPPLHSPGDIFVGHAWMGFLNK